MPTATASTSRKKLFEVDSIHGKIYSNGWVKGDSLVDVVEPATGATLLQVGLGSAATVARAARKCRRSPEEVGTGPARGEAKAFHGQWYEAPKER